MPGLLTIHPICLRLPFQIELNCNLVLARLVRVRDLRVRNLKSRSILHIERKLSSAKLRLSPVPPPKRMLLVLDCDAIPDLESLARAIEVLPNICQFHVTLLYNINFHTSGSKPSNCITSPSLVISFSSYPFAARLHCAPPI